MHIRNPCQKNINWKHWCKNTANMQFQDWITYLCSQPKSSKVNAFLQNIPKGTKGYFFSIKKSHCDHSVYTVLWQFLHIKQKNSDDSKGKKPKHFSIYESVVWLNSFMQHENLELTETGIQHHISDATKRHKEHFHHCHVEQRWFAVLLQTLGVPGSSADENDQNCYST